MRARLAVAGTALLASASLLHAQAAAPGCERAPRSGRAALHGVVQDSVTRLPLQRLKVALSWEENGGRRRTQEQETDLAGAFHFCDVAAATGLTVAAQLGDRAVKALELEAGEARRVDLMLNATRSAVAGRVLDAAHGRGIAEVEVRVRDSDVRAVTRSDGSFALPDLPAGVHWFEISHVAYQARQDSVRVEYGARMQLTIHLAESVIALRPIEVEVRSHMLARAGFYQRQERGFGTYLTRRDWDGRMPQFPSDVMRTVAGVRVVPRSGGFGSVLLDRGNCAFRYIMDGARIGPTFQIDDIPVEWIEAMEIYRGPSQVPGQFTFPPSQARASCGVIVIWTRAAR